MARKPALVKVAASGKRTAKERALAVRIQVVDGVLVVPEAAVDLVDLARHLEALDDPTRDVDVDQLHARILELPGEDRRLPLDEGPGLGQGVGRTGADGDLAVRGVVERVAGARVVPGDVLPLQPVEGAGVERRVDVPDGHLDPLVVDRVGPVGGHGVGKHAGGGVDLRAPAQRPGAVGARGVGVGAADAELESSPAAAGRTGRRPGQPAVAALSDANRASASSCRSARSGRPSR